MTAAKCRSNDAIDVLLHAEADPNIIDSNGRTALSLAIFSKDIATIDKLCGVTTTTRVRKEVFKNIADKRITMSGPLAKYVTDSLSNAGEGIGWIFPLIIINQL